MTGGANLWLQPSTFALFHGGRLVFVFMTKASCFSALFDLIEHCGVSVVDGGREDPVPPSPLRLVEFFQPAHSVDAICQCRLLRRLSRWQWLQIASNLLSVLFSVLIIIDVVDMAVETSGGPRLPFFWYHQATPTISMLPSICLILHQILANTIIW